MGRKLQNPKEGIRQKSVGFRSRQWDFFYDHPTFRPDIHCRNSVDNQIRLMYDQDTEEHKKMREKYLDGEEETE